MQGIFSKVVLRQTHFSDIKTGIYMVNFADVYHTISMYKNNLI